MAIKTGIIRALDAGFNFSIPCKRMLKVKTSILMQWRRGKTMKGCKDGLMWSEQAIKIDCYSSILNGCKWGTTGCVNTRKEDVAVTEMQDERRPE